MANRFFRVLIPYNDKMTTASVQEMDHPVQFRYQVVLPDYTTHLVTYADMDKDPKMVDDANEANFGYTEETKGRTTLAINLGKAIDSFLSEGYQPFTVTINGEEYTLMGCTDATTHEENYSVFKDGGLLFVLHLDDEGIWELNEESSDPVGNVNETLIEQLAEKIQAQAG